MGYHKQVTGFLARGGDVPVLNPFDVVIVGLDVPESDDLWFASCPRATEEVEPAFVDDVRRNGVREPISVALDGANTCLLLDGRRRLKAARIVRAEEEERGVPEEDRTGIRAVIRKGKPADLFGINIGPESSRKSLSPVQRAEAMQTALNHDVPIENVAKMFQISEGTVRNTLALLQCSDDVRRALTVGVESDGRVIVLAAHLASEFAALPRAKQKETLIEMLGAGAVRGAAARNAIRDKKRGKAIRSNNKAKLRSGDFAARWRDAIDKKGKTVEDTPRPVMEVALRVVEFMLGGKKALDDMPTVREAAIEAGAKLQTPRKPRKGKRSRK